MFGLMSDESSSEMGLLFCFSSLLKLAKSEIPNDLESMYDNDK